MCFASKPRIQNAPPVFGVPLTDSSRSAEYQYVPKIVVKCVEFIERKENITTPGLYRVNVNDFILSEVRNKVETKADYRPLQRGKLKSVHVVTGVFMLFFREMTTNLITTDVLDYLALELDFTHPSNIPKIAKCLQILDDPYYQTLKFLISHLHQVSHFSKQNMMTASDLAFVWMGCLFANASRWKTPEQIAKYHKFLKMLIQRYAIIFN